MVHASQIPAPTHEDALPNANAVWRSGRPHEAEQSNRRISVDYGGGIIARTYVGSVPDWGRVVVWRFGWPPSA